ncbi:MAG: efflux RND transporter periplasmic adaptor subunit [Jaaginema sp. PMC 1079.18]|nr:efflux RND transporter periplasmic adaptor subunit [Jaaginema sp. PMC 1080.18]MEC4849551.1 efflux RND transporter periplasmic adaptor subunit [Jaaginema sp. PMC 1079.18]MEC4867905.1 efflux RND transporter periplasmic adaptor subunit [Jaaginema sp. PMC 1078.18]
MVLLLGAIAPSCSRAPLGGENAPGIPVTVKEVKLDTLEESSEFVGTLEAQSRVELQPRVEGRVLQILVKSGDRVETGTPVIQLEPTQNQAEVSAAVANVTAQKASLNNARAELNASRAEVARLAAQVAQQEAEVQRLQAELDLAKVNYNRTQGLVEQQVLPRQELDNKKRDLDTAQASVNAARQALVASRNAQRVAEERVEAARANLDRDNAAVAQAEAQVNVVSQDLEFNRIVAPISGVLGDVRVKVGDIVNSDDVLAIIVQNNALELRIAVPVERSEQLRVGLPVELLLEGDRVIRGRISFVSPEVDREAQAILAKATFPNDGILRDGQFVRARAIWDSNPGISIPTTAISRIGGQTFVFVPETNSEQGTIAKQRPIQLGEVQGQQYQVVSGLEAGEEIVTEGILKLSDGAPIVVQD